MFTFALLVDLDLDDFLPIRSADNIYSNGNSPRHCSLKARYQRKSHRVVGGCDGCLYTQGPLFTELSDQKNSHRVLVAARRLSPTVVKKYFYGFQKILDSIGRGFASACAKGRGIIGTSPTTQQPITIITTILFSCLGSSSFYQVGIIIEFLFA
jgi:hypothetical protein